MTNDQAESARIEIVPAAKEDEPILANLIELYAHDFSEFYGVELGADGRFGYKSLPLYWSEPGRHPFLVRIDGKLAGFVLVKRGSEVSGNDGVWDIAEFFVVRSYRRHGAGTRVAQEVWKRFPGAWEVRVLQANVAALHFWAHAIAGFTGEAIFPIRVEHDGEHWMLFSFGAEVAI
jgi:predicted acetyltransferase